MSPREDETIKIYTGELLPEQKPLYFLRGVFQGNYDNGKHLWNLFQGASEDAPFDFLQITDDPTEADFFLAPYDYFSLRKVGGAVVDGYISRLVSLAEKNKKKILVFAMADSDEHIPVRNAYVFRYSQYRYKKKENEILLPPYMLHARSPNLETYRENIWKNISLRDKGTKPLVSFCGWAGFPSSYRVLTFYARVLLFKLKKYILRNKYAELHMHGIYFRRKAMEALKKSPFVATNFLVRKSFSAQRGIDGGEAISPEVAERESIDSIINSDFVLAPKGHGNASVRFFEALSLGRFPVLVNTDCVLPLEKNIDYSKFVVFVDYTRIKDSGKIVADFYRSLSAEEFQRRQRLAREAFLSLRPAAFLKTALRELKFGF